MASGLQGAVQVSPNVLLGNGPMPKVRQASRCGRGARRWRLDCAARGLVFCAVLAWSQFRLVRFAADEKAALHRGCWLSALRCWTACRAWWRKPITSPEPPWSGGLSAGSCQQHSLCVGGRVCVVAGNDTLCRGGTSYENQAEERAGGAVGGQQCSGGAP